MVNTGWNTVYDHTEYLTNLNQNGKYWANTFYDHTKYLMKLNQNGKYRVKYRLWSYQIPNEVEPEW